MLILRVQIPNGLAHHQTQFDLIVQTDALGAENRAAVGEEDGGSGLQEEEGLLGGGVVQLGNVIAVKWWISTEIETEKYRGRESSWQIATGMDIAGKGPRTRSYDRYT